MNKSDLIAAVATQAGVSQKDAGAVVDAFVTVVTDAVKKGEDVRLVGFGTFASKVVQEKQGKNPRTGEKITIPGGRRPAFKVSKAFVEAVRA